MNQPPRSGEAPLQTEPRDPAVLGQWAHDAAIVLSGLTEHLKLIPHEGLDDAARHHLDAALLEGAALSRMIAGRGGAPDAGETAEPDLIGHELALVYGVLARQRGASLNVSVGPDVPARPGIDRVALERIAVNLVDNAIRHSGGGRIVVAFGVTNAAHLSLSVTDDGAGFPVEVLAGRFGAGLASVSDLVEALGGRLRLGTRDGGGAEVSVELPGAEMSVPAGRTADEAGSLAGREVLVVDAGDAAPALISAAFAARGAEVEILRSGAEALSALEGKPYDLVIVDTHPGAVSGAEVIRALKARAGIGGRTPALAISEDASVDCHDALIAAGADRVLAKPLPGPAELSRIAERMIGTAGRQAVPEAAVPAPEPAAGNAGGDMPDEPLFDPEPLLRVCALAGPEVGAEIVERLIADLTETLDRLTRASTPPDVMELRAASHVLIALAGTGGAMQLLSRTQALNRLLHTGALDALGPKLAEVKLLTAGAIAAIRRLPPLGAPGGSAGTEAP